MNCSNAGHIAIVKNAPGRELMKIDMTGMSKYLFLLILVIILPTQNSCQNKENTNKSSQKQYSSTSKSDDYLNKINQSLNEKENQNSKKETSFEKVKYPDDGSWALLIDDKKISKEAFEREYNKWHRLSRNKIDKKQFVNIFLQNYILINRGKRYFASKKRRALLNFVRRQAVTQYYLKHKIYNKKVKSPSKKELFAFHSQLSRHKNFKHLTLKKNKAKIIKLFKLQKTNQRYFHLEQSLKGEYKIIKNDEWEEKLINKYINKKVNIRKALGSGYKKYWLFKIIFGKSRKIFYIKDIEHKLKLMHLMGANRKLLRAFKRDPNVRQQFVNRFLIEELIYRKLKEKGILYSKSYKNRANLAVKNFTTRYYLQNVLKLRTTKQKRNYILNFLNSHKIKISEIYFNHG